jgi:hypothetical protein
MDAAVDLEPYAWSDYKHIEKHVNLHIRKSYDSFRNLVTGRCLGTELLMLKRTTLRLALRLKTAKITRAMKQVAKYYHDYLTSEHPNEVMTVFMNEKFDARSGSVLLPSHDAVDKLITELTSRNEMLEKMINYTTYAYGECMPWLRLGHLSSHVITLISSLSRLHIIAKALLIHSCDAITGLKSLPGHNHTGQPVGHDNDTPLVTKDEKAIRVNRDVRAAMEEDVGVLISRTSVTKDGTAKSSRVVESAANTSKKKKSKRKKKIGDKSVTGVKVLCTETAKKSGKKGK